MDESASTSRRLAIVERLLDALAFAAAAMAPRTRRPRRPVHGRPLSRLPAKERVVIATMVAKIIGAMLSLVAHESSRVAAT